MLGILGLGKMGQSLVRGILNGGTLSEKDIVVYDIDSSRMNTAKELGVRTASDEKDLVRKSNEIVLAIIPQKMENVLRKISTEFSPGQLVISIAAGITRNFVKNFVPPEVHVVRAMPNLPAMVGYGVTVLAADETVPEEYKTRAEQIWSAVGRVFWLDEELMDAVTALSGSGPAYTFLFVEALTDAGVRVGIPRDTAYQLALHTVLGAAQLLNVTGKHPIVYKDMVTSPGGTAISGVEALERNGFRIAVFEAVKAASQRAEQISNKLTQKFFTKHLTEDT